MMSGFNVGSSLKYVAPEAETNREVWLGRLWVILILLLKKEYVLQIQLNESKALHLWKCNLKLSSPLTKDLVSLLLFFTFLKVSVKPVLLTVIWAHVWSAFSFLFDQ